METMTDVRIVIAESLNSLSQWVNQEGTYGWDPYDALYSPWGRNLKNPYLRVLLIQLNNYSPFNLRPLLKVKKGLDLKGTAVFAPAYAKMYRLTQDEFHLEKLREGLEFIESSSLRGNYGYDCWASHYYPFVTVDNNRLEVGSPDIIGTSRSIIALLEGYKILQDPKLLDMTISASHFLVDMLFQEDALFPHFKYTISETIRIVPNASAHALEALTAVLQIRNDSTLKDICEKMAQALIEIQREDGSWMYSMFPDGRTKRVQLDFHQGYMIDGLLSFLPFSEEKDNLIACIESGAYFYKNALFRRNGSSYYRHPIPYPIDIHNQAQGIISFAKMSKLNEEYLEFAKLISIWTITNMQDESGYFYHQKWPLITNKTPHMRWGQAWMMLALTTILENLDGEFS